MPPLDTLLFLACFTIVPLAIVALLTYQLVAWGRDRLAIARLRDRGWMPIDADDRALHAALEDLGLASPRARLFDRWRLGEGDDAIVVVTRRIRRGGGSSELGRGSSVTLVIAGRSQREPIGVVSRRQGGVLESALLTFAAKMGDVPIAPAGWEWAIVGSPSASDAWSAAAGAALEEHLAPGEYVRLGTRHVALAARARSMSELMSGARERLDVIRQALGR